MRLLDRWPRGREGVTIAVAIGVIAALLGSAAAIYTWGGNGSSSGAGDTPAATTPTRSGDALVAVVSRAGGFAVTAPPQLVGEKVDRGVKLSTRAGDIVITVGPTGDKGLRAGHASALDAIRSTFPRVHVERRLRTELGALPARRSVGVVRRARGDQIIFSVTTGVRGRRTWSVVMFAARDVRPARLERFYQPILDGFEPVAR